ncbi:hypothetical protein [Planktotalea sp.]|uniref:hypothetical protein n=1 Tax=Planktotalea sp. TaxID=2029877 RepID=UPI00329A26CD
MTDQNSSSQENHIERDLKGLLRWAFGLAFIFLGCLWFSGALNSLAPFLGGQELNDSNVAYIDTVQTQAVKELTTLGAILAVVDVVASVEVGFNFVASAEIGIGHAIQSFALLLRQAMDALVLSTAAFEVLTLLLAISNAVSGPIFAISLICFGALCVVRNFAALPRLHTLVEGVTFTAISLFLLTYIIVPYSIQISAWCSMEITHALHAATRDGLSALDADIVERATNTSTPQDWTKRGTAIAAYEHLSNDLPQKVKSAAWLIWAFWARVLIHAVAIPILVAFVLRQIFHHVLKTALLK